MQNRFAVYIRGTVTGAALNELGQKLSTARAEQADDFVGAIMEKLRAEGEGDAKSPHRLFCGGVTCTLMH